MEVIDEVTNHSFVKFRSVKQRAMFAIIVMSLAALLLLTTFLLETYLINLFEKVLNGNMAAYLKLEKIATLHDRLEIVQVVIYLGSFITFFMWLYIAHNNLYVNKVRGMQLSSGQAVGFFFIPLANLYFSVLSLNEVFKGTKHVFDNKPLTNPIGPEKSLIPIFWLICQLVSGMSARFGIASLNENNITLARVKSAFTADCISFASSALAFALILTYLVKVTSMQEKIIAQHS